jgi:hypothetical protein
MCGIFPQTLFLAHGLAFLIHMNMKYVTITLTNSQIDQSLHYHGHHIIPVQSNHFCAIILVHNIRSRGEIRI